MQRPKNNKNPNRSIAARNRCQECCVHCKKNHRKCNGEDPCSSCVRSRTPCVRSQPSSRGQSREKVLSRMQEDGACNSDLNPSSSQRQGGPEFFILERQNGYLMLLSKGGGCYAARLNEHYQIISQQCYIGQNSHTLEFSRNFTVDELVNTDTSSIDALFVKPEPPIMMDHPSPSSDYTSSSASSVSSPPPPPRTTLIDYSQKRLYSGSEVHRGGFTPPGWAPL